MKMGIFWPAAGCHSPCQEPVSGCPSCAQASTAMPEMTKRLRQKKDRLRITPQVCKQSPFYTEARSKRKERGVNALFSAIVNVPDAALLAVADVQRAIGGLRHSVRPRHGVVGIHQRGFTGKTAREYLECARRLSA